MFIKGIGERKSRDDRVVTRDSHVCAGHERGRRAEEFQIGRLIVKPDHLECIWRQKLRP